MLNSDLFAYEQTQPFHIREAGSREQAGVITRNFTYENPFGQRRAAFLVHPTAEGPHPVILYVHWYEPDDISSHRTQFLHEAQTMAQRGAASLLIETLWSDRDFFLKRTQDDDYQNSIRQVIELRQAADLLLDQVKADRTRFAYVGHDFGAMYGTVMGAIDPRPSCYVLMAGTPHFPDWYLYYPPLEGNMREAFIQQMAPFDPIANIAQLAPAPLFLQFATNDPHVPVERAEAFFAAAAEPKQIGWYEAGHGLNDVATAERIEWLTQRLGR